MRPERLVSVHFPKAGGSSLHSQLARQLGGTLGLDIAFDPVRRPGDDPLPWKPGVRAMHGHFRPWRYLVPGAFLTTFLRDPVDNLLSIYFYWEYADTTVGSHALHRQFLRERPDVVSFARFPALNRLMSETYFGGFDMRRFDFIGFHESRDADLPRLGERIGLALCPEVHEHRTTPSARRTDIEGDPRLIGAVRDRLAEDMRFYERVRRDRTARQGAG